MLLATAFSYSPAPILTAGAPMLTIMAYTDAKHRPLLRMGIVLALFAAGHYYAVSAFGRLMQTGASPEIKVLRVIASEELLIGVASAVMLISVMIGVHGPASKAEFQAFLRKHRDDGAAPKN